MTYHRIRIEEIQDRTISFCEDLLDHTDIGDPVEIAFSIERMIGAVDGVIKPLSILSGTNCQHARANLRALRVVNDLAFENVGELVFDSMDQEDRDLLMTELVEMMDTVGKITSDILNSF